MLPINPKREKAKRIKKMSSEALGATVALPPQIYPTNEGSPSSVTSRALAALPRDIPLKGEIETKTVEGKTVRGVRVEGVFLPANIPASVSDGQAAEVLIKSSATQTTVAITILSGKVAAESGSREVPLSALEDALASLKLSTKQLQALRQVLHEGRQALPSTALKPFVNSQESGLFTPQETNFVALSALAKQLGTELQPISEQSMRPELLAAARQIEEALRQTLSSKQTVASSENAADPTLPAAERLLQFVSLLEKLAAGEPHESPKLEAALRAFIQRQLVAPESSEKLAEALKHITSGDTLSVLQHTLSAIEKNLPQPLSEADAAFGLFLKNLLSDLAKVLAKENPAETQQFLLKIFQRLEREFGKPLASEPNAGKTGTQYDLSTPFARAHQATYSQLHLALEELAQLPKNSAPEVSSQIQLRVQESLSRILADTPAPKNPTERAFQGTLRDLIRKLEKPMDIAALQKLVKEAKVSLNEATLSPSFQRARDLTAHLLRFEIESPAFRPPSNAEPREVRATTHLAKILQQWGRTEKASLDELQQNLSQFILRHSARVDSLTSAQKDALLRLLGSHNEVSVASKPLGTPGSALIASLPQGVAHQSASAQSLLHVLSSLHSEPFLNLTPQESAFLSLTSRFLGELEKGGLKTEEQFRGSARQALQSVSESFGKAATASQLNGSSQELRQNLSSLDNWFRGQEALQRLNPAMRAAGEPAFILFPAVIQGFLADVELSHRNIFGNGEGEGSAGKSGQEKQGEEVSFSTTLPGLGEVGIDLFHHEGKVRVRLHVENDEKQEFLTERLPLLRRKLHKDGFETEGLEASRKEHRKVRPQWVNELTNRSGVIA